MKRIIRITTIVVLALGAAMIIFAPNAATATEPVTKTVAWILPDGGTHDRVTWPQPIADEANLAAVPCGATVTLQVDVYPYGTESERARTDALTADGILNNGEDHGWVTDWWFTDYTAPDCTIERPVAQVNAPTITPAVGSCVDGVWTQTTATVTLTSNGNGFWTTETRWDADRLEENVPYAILGEQTYYYTGREGAVLSDDLAGGYLDNGWVAFTVTPNAVDADECAVIVPPIDEPVYVPNVTDTPTVATPDAVTVGEVPVTAAETPTQTVVADATTTPQTRVLAATGMDANVGMIAAYWTLALLFAGSALVSISRIRARKASK